MQPQDMDTDTIFNSAVSAIIDSYKSYVEAGDGEIAHIQGESPRCVAEDMIARFECDLAPEQRYAFQTNMVSALMRYVGATGAHKLEIYVHIGRQKPREFSKDDGAMYWVRAFDGDTCYGDELPQIHRHITPDGEKMALQSNPEVNAINARQNFLFIAIGAPQTTKSGTCDKQAVIESGLEVLTEINPEQAALLQELSEARELTSAECRAIENINTYETLRDLAMLAPELQEVSQILDKTKIYMYQALEEVAEQGGPEVEAVLGSVFESAETDEPEAKVATEQEAGQEEGLQGHDPESGSVAEVAEQEQAEVEAVLESVFESAETDEPEAKVATEQEAGQEEGLQGHDPESDAVFEGITDDPALAQDRSAKEYKADEVVVEQDTAHSSDKAAIATVQDISSGNKASMGRSPVQTLASMVDSDTVGAQQMAPMTGLQLSHQPDGAVSAKTAYRPASSEAPQVSRGASQKAAEAQASTKTQQPQQSDNEPTLAARDTDDIRGAPVNHNAAVAQGDTTKHTPIMADLNANSGTSHEASQVSRGASQKAAEAQASTKTQQPQQSDKEPTLAARDTDDIRGAPVNHNATVAQADTARHTSIVADSNADSDTSHNPELQVAHMQARQDDQQAIKPVTVQEPEAQTEKQPANSPEEAQRSSFTDVSVSSDTRREGVVPNGRNELSHSAATAMAEKDRRGPGTSRQEASNNTTGNHLSEFVISPQNGPANGPDAKTDLDTSRNDIRFKMPYPDSEYATKTVQQWDGKPNPQPANMPSAERVKLAYNDAGNYVCGPNCTCAQKLQKQVHDNAGPKSAAPR